MSTTDTPFIFTFTITPDMMREDRARFEREVAARAAHQARLQENYRLTRATRLRKIFVNVTRFKPTVLVHELAEYERGEGRHGGYWREDFLSSVSVYINVVDTLLRLAIEATGYRGPQDSGDTDAARIHAAQEIQARRQATRARKKAEADQAYRAEAVAREMADPRISATHKTKVAAGEVDPIILDEDGKPSLDWVLTGKAMQQVERDEAVLPMMKLDAALTWGGEPAKCDWITTLPKDTLIPFIDAAPGYIAYLQEVQRLAQPGQGAPSLRLVPCGA